MASGQPLVVADAHEDPRIVSPDADVQSLVIAPVRFAGEVTGILELEHHKRHAYRARDFTAIATIATQVATAMHIADLRRPLVATIGQIGEQVGFLAGTTEALRTGAGALSTAAGGLFTSNVNERSLNTVITTGTVMPRLSLVRSLNCCTNCPMLTPCWPSAGPTGGAGVACPPGH